MSKGKLIVIEGLDGCGKATQANLLKEKLEKLEKKVKLITFPDYKSDGSILVRMYLDGKLADNAKDINAYAASTFFAVDRYISFLKNWKDDYESGTIIISDRYTTSNATLQTAKLPKDKWDEFLAWLEDFEYKKLSIPKPDKVIYLEMNNDISQKLLTKRYNGNESKKDLHEKDISYMNSSKVAATYVSKALNWDCINCCENDILLSIEDISKKIFSIISDFLEIY